VRVPPDARFLGGPIDYVVFDGLDEGDFRRIVFVTDKAAKARLNGRESSVRRCVDNAKIEFETLRPALPEPDSPFLAEYPTY
jgi:predicted Holliday junction resolvase-like endonuclease